jgi:molecular chaperone DnaJ
MFKDVSEAYSVLSDDKKKHLFDMGHNVDGQSASAGEQGFGGGFGGADMSDIFAQFGGSFQRNGQSFRHGHNNFGFSSQGNPFGFG